MSYSVLCVLFCVDRKHEAPFWPALTFDVQVVDGAQGKTKIESQLLLEITQKEELLKHGMDGSVLLYALPKEFQLVFFGPIGNLI